MLKDTNLSKVYQSIYLKAESLKDIKKYLLGKEKEFRINTRDSYFCDISDTDVLLKYCLYPLHFNGYINVVNDIFMLLLKMANSDNVLEVFQVYSFIASQEKFVESYIDVPFVLDFTEVLDILYEHRKYHKSLFENYKGEEFNTFGLSLWNIVVNICDNSISIQNYLRNKM